jgi:hypothetical protein
MHTLPIAPPAPDPDDDSPAAIARAQGLLATLSITGWSARKKDKRASADVTNAANAARDAASVSKHLLGGHAPLHAAILAAATSARAVHDRYTLPWGGRDCRLLPSGAYWQYTAAVQVARDRYRAAVDAFLPHYPELREAARDAGKLGGLFTDSDYPTPDELAAKFTFRVSLDPVPASSDIRLGLPQAVQDQIARSIEARVSRAVTGAVQAGWDRLAGTVVTLRDRLQEIAASGGRLHDSLFANVVETAEILRTLNILQDPQLDRMAARVAAEIAALDPQAIRQTPAGLQDAAARVDEILQDMAGLFGGGAA